MSNTVPHNWHYALNSESTIWYIVYPPWAKFSYRWEDLPRLFANPLATSYTDPISALYSRESKEQYWRDLGWPTEYIEPARLINGPVGGGIISVKRVPNGKWLPLAIFIKEANIRSPNVLMNSLNKLPFDVTYLEPFDSPLRDYLHGKLRPKIYLCDPTPEHITSDLEGIYWVIGIKKGRNIIQGIEQLHDWVSAFGIEIFALPETPEILRAETSPWFIDPDIDLLWFRINGGGNGAGYHYAVILYTSMYLRYAIGPRMKYMHLLANIEGELRIRENWFKKKNP